jgi:hypothetical protein
MNRRRKLSLATATSVPGFIPKKPDTEKWRGYALAYDDDERSSQSILTL